MPVIRPSNVYVALLDIKAIIREWQDLKIGDRTAMEAINKVSIELQKKEWKESHE